MILATPTRFSVPQNHLMIFKDGHPVAMDVGSLSRSQLHAFLDAHTGAGTLRLGAGVAAGLSPGNLYFAHR